MHDLPKTLIWTNSSATERRRSYRHYRLSLGRTVTMRQRVLPRSVMSSSLTQRSMMTMVSSRHHFLVLSTFVHLHLRPSPCAAYLFSCPIFFRRNFIAHQNYILTDCDRDSRFQFYRRCGFCFDPMLCYASNIAFLLSFSLMAFFLLAWATTFSLLLFWH